MKTKTPSKKRALYNGLMAAAIVVIIPTLIMVLVFQKQIVAGISHGAVKE